MTGMINGFFWVGKFGISIFGGGGGWIYVGIFFAIQNNLKIHGIAPYAGCIVLQIKYHQNFPVILFNSSWKFLRFGNVAF